MKHFLVILIALILASCVPQPEPNYVPQGHVVSTSEGELVAGYQQFIYTGEQTKDGCLEVGEEKFDKTSCTTTLLFVVIISDDILCSDGEKRGEKYYYSNDSTTVQVQQLFERSDGSLYYNNSKAPPFTWPYPGITGEYRGEVSGTEYPVVYTADSGNYYMVMNATCKE